MAWRAATRMGRVYSVALAVAGVAAIARPAAAQDYERILAGVRLNSTSKSVLARYGNPNEVIIGDVGVRGGGPTSQPGVGGSGAQGDKGDMSGMQGGMQGGGMPMAPPPTMGSGAPSLPNVGGGRSMGAPSSMGMGGPSMPMGGPGMPNMPGGGDFPPPPGMNGGSGFPDASGQGTGQGIGQFGQTISTLARQQEVTWIYNRKIKDNLVSYEFLIGPAGNVVQIRVSGYSGGNSRTKKGLSLGATYKDVVSKYGYPEEHYQVGRILVASYRNKAHVQFQFMNERGQANPMASGNKIVAITIATVE